MTELSDRVAFAKRNCVLCKGRSRLRPVETERKNAQDGLKSLVESFNAQFNQLRHEDAETQAINNAIENKRLCMDILEQCQACDKEVDIVNRRLGELRK
jgi:hypothetical protein